MNGCCRTAVAGLAGSMIGGWSAASFTCFDPARACTTIYNRFNRWSRQGIWLAMFKAVTG
jgi:hypothetical protein